MGSPIDEPMRSRNLEDQREVTLTHSFLLGQFEITQREWTDLGFVNRAGTKRDGGRDCMDASCPAAMMTWYEAVQFTNARSDREGLPHCIELEGCQADGGATGTEVRCAAYRQTTPSYYDCRGYRLPTQAEFEYAIRAGTTTAFYTGPFEPSGDGCFDVPHVSEAAWYCANSENSTHPVGEKKPNAWGLHDMMGNAAEWVASNPYEVATGHVPEQDPLAVLSATNRFGGAGWFFSYNPSTLRSATPPKSYNITVENAVRPGLGLRVARTLTPEEAAKF